MTKSKGVDFLNDPDLKVRDLSYTRSRVGQLLDLTKGSFFDMGFGPRDDDLTADQLDNDDDWPSDRLEVYVKHHPRGPGYVCDVVYHSEHLPVTVYAVLVNRGHGLEVAELELFRRTWGYFDEFDNYVAPDTDALPNGHTPPALITSDILRRIPLGDIVARAQRWLADDSWRTEGIRSYPGPDLKPYDLTDQQRRALETSTNSVPRRRGRPELSNELLVDVAEAYIQEAGRGRGAISRMANAFDRPEATIRDWISIARRRGYLAPTRPGRRGAAPGPQLPKPIKRDDAEGNEHEFRPNLSRDRRRHIMRLIEGEGLLTADVSDDARILYIVGGLVCNDVGVARQADLHAAIAEPEILEVAVEILAKARQRADKRGTDARTNPSHSKSSRRKRS